MGPESHVTSHRMLYLTYLDAKDGTCFLPLAVEVERESYLTKPWNILVYRKSEFGIGMERRHHLISIYSDFFSIHLNTLSEWFVNFEGLKICLWKFFKLVLFVCLQPSGSCKHSCMHNHSINLCCFYHIFHNQHLLTMSINTFLMSSFFAVVAFEVSVALFSWKQLSILILALKSNFWHYYKVIKSVNCLLNQQVSPVLLQVKNMKHKCFDNKI